MISFATAVSAALIAGMISRLVLGGERQVSASHANSQLSSRHWPIEKNKTVEGDWHSRDWYRANSALRLPSRAARERPPARILRERGRFQPL
jgi:hypothetical protein